MISKSDTSVRFCKVLAHTGAVGNGFADAIAKHAALHKYGHDNALLPRSPDGNPLSHVYWLAKEKNETNDPATKDSLALLQNMKDKLKAHMSKHHRLGDASTGLDYYNFWMRLLTPVNLTTSNSFWNKNKLTYHRKKCHEIQNRYSLHPETGPP